MASWKEKEVVPDSDDEGAVDSQSTSSIEGNPEVFLGGKDGFRDYRNTADGDDEEEIPEKGKSNTHEDVLLDPQITIQNDSVPLHTQDSAEELTKKSSLSPSIPQSPKKFKDPRLYWGSYEEGASSIEENASLSRTRRGVPIDDEISKSYVQITSPISTQLSSPPSSELPLPPHANTYGQRRVSRSPNAAMPSQHSIVNGMRLQDTDPPTSTAKRSLRQRNLIQLHPYAMEQEIYRRTLQSRGIAPMRMVSSSQEHSRRRSHSPSSVLESQDVNDDVGGSQQDDMDWDPPSSPPRPEESFEDTAMDGATPPKTVDEGDEFPDIDELIRNPNQLPRKPERKSKQPPQPKFKHRLKTYSMKFKSPGLPRIQTQPLGQTKQRNNADSIFDVPASPPKTSSPFTTSSRRGRAPFSRAGSTSKDQTPSTSPAESLLARGDLPTPVTSAIKPVPVSLNSDAGLDDPFASDIEKSDSSSSSSDESIQIRKISKKIRGVLPASHLRLDQKKLPSPVVHTLRDGFSLSPVKELSRRGVALPRLRQSSQSPPTSTNAMLPFLSDSGEDDENDEPGSVTTDDPFELESVLDQSRSGFAVEDDKIDAMLPPKKRLSNASLHPRKKRKSGSGLGVHTGSSSYRQQSKITDHLQRPKRHLSLGKSTGRSRGRSHLKKPAPPRLGILDVMTTLDGGERDLPHFIRVAARTARARVGQGRQSPSRKFIRLANREDTQDVQSVLQDWRDGKITSMNRNAQPRRPLAAAGSALHQISGNQQTRFPPSIIKSKPKLSKEPVQSGRETPLIQDREPLVQHNKDIKPGLASKSRHAQHAARPAQLESSEIPYSARHSASTFRSTKRVLDALYRSTRRRPAPQTNLQLSRFLADDDVVQPSIEISHDLVSDNDDDEVDLVQVSAKPTRRKQNAPRRVDAGAANYRQPSDPLILDYFAPTETNTDDNSKLLGLGKFGTNYSVNFNIFPMLPGVFFHESTIIGSGRLAEILSDSRSERFSASSPTSLKFADKVFKWTTWNENVSSEIGVCFDWLLDQLQFRQSLTPPTADANEVITFVLNYVQYNVRFDGRLDHNDYMARMIEVLRDFSGRIVVSGTIDQAQTRLSIEVLSRCTLVIFQLLKSIRAQPEANSSAYDVVNLLKLVAGHCATALISDGLDKLRTLYDDLQYLSVRERGITSDQYAANGWLVLIKSLNTAHMPRGSFWDVINTRVLSTRVKGFIYAPELEKIWYTMYTLLPLCEFDIHGVVETGLRQRINFDDWSLPQQILKQVFSLYRANDRQPPGFNDYCRALLHRCHYLMVEWGWWKCSTIIGTLFDFFASHNLAHLRNEEAHASPSFLEQLDTEPSLVIEPEDRCFHIFLKIVALGIKHLSAADDIKGIRNLVARLLPNHDRQYPKDEVIHTRDLAALRNHHDLLCTLFWASPPPQRPSATLIEELVIADRSHNEACFISIRAWENLARFMVTNGASVDLYKPFRHWQTGFFSSLSQQYLGAETEARQQAEALERSSGQVTSESTVADTILVNRRSMVVPMCRSITAMGNTIKAARSSEMVREALNTDVLSKALDPTIHDDVGLAKRLAADCVVAICNYMDQIKQFHPHVVPETVLPDHEEESQDSIDVGVDWDRMELIIPLRQSIVGNLSPLLRKYLEGRCEQDSTVMSNMVMCWARLVAIITEEGAMPLESFLTRGQHAVFEDRRSFKTAEAYWPLFLVTLFQNGKTLKDLQFPGFNVALEWLLGTAICQSVSAPMQALTTELKQHGHYLCSSIDPGSFDQIQVIRAATRSMSSILIEKTTETTVGLPQKQAQRLFADMLGEVMKSMQDLLELLEPGSELHNYHLQVARVIIADIKSYASDFRPLIDFFIHPSKHYWPHDADPSMYRPGLIAYCLRLEQQPDKAAFELYYYLHSGWTKALVQNRLDNFRSCIKTGMKWWDFTKFMLSDFIPAIIATGFNSSAWLLCSVFLPAVSGSLINMLEGADHKSTWIFESLLNVLKMIMNGTIMQAHLYERNLLGIHPNHHGILAVVYKFWFAVALPMRQYAIRHSQEAALEEVSDPLSSFIYHTVHAFQTGDPFIQVPEGQFDVRKGKHTDGFVKHILDDIKDNWQFSDVECFRVTVKTRSMEFSTMTVFRDSLKEVLEVDLELYECAYPNRQNVVIEKARNAYIDDLYM